MPLTSRDSGAFAGTGVRFAFLVPNSLLRQIKQLALDRETAVSELVRSWIDTGLAHGFDEQPQLPMTFDGPMRQYPVNVPSTVRLAIQARCDETDLSGAQLLRRWLVHGLARERYDGDRSPV
ncbi:MAG: hypothetical protein IT196_03180 [Acidimicrobiales bacterium]|nr:hypothetical protein [Acidimicrobiales bacterium]